MVYWKFGIFDCINEERMDVLVALETYRKGGFLMNGFPSDGDGLWLIRTPKQYLWFLEHGSLDGFTI